MRHQVYSVKDGKAHLFSPPMLSISEGTMRRSIIDVLRDEKHPYARHPEDYMLFYLGEFEDATGIFYSEEIPVSLVLLSDLLSVDR